MTAQGMYQFSGTGMSTIFVAVDGKAIKAAAEKCNGKRAPIMLHVLDVATGLVKKRTFRIEQ